MNTVIIIGGGFAGLAAAARLGKSNRDLEVTLIDKQKEFNFLPMLPDIIGRGIEPRFVTNRIEDLSKAFGFNFINQEVVRVDLEKKEVYTNVQTLNYDYLIIACGSETNFYGNENIRKYAYKLDNARDAELILRALENNKLDSYIIAGGGYTGIEIATNLRAYFEKRAKDKRIIIVERAPTILGPLPQWLKDYVLANLKELNIELYLNTVIEKIEGGRILLSSQNAFEKPMLIWAAGVKIPDFTQSLRLEKTNQGRLKVDQFLKLRNNCFIIGDAANFIYAEKPLRMAVQFAIFQGRLAARNIINSIEGVPLKEYEPLDLGYIIPMANNKSCGRVFGLDLKGRLPTIFHFLMCIYRSYGLRNRWGIIKDLIKGGA